MKHVTTIQAMIEGLLEANKSVIYFDDNGPRRVIIAEMFEDYHKDFFHHQDFSLKARSLPHFDVVIAICPPDRPNDWIAQGGMIVRINL